MGVSATFVVQAYLSAAWVDLTPDTIAIAGMGGSYGIDGNGPSDCVASPGQLQFTLRNDAKSSGGVQGYYSPRHANVRAGWGFGVAVRWVWTYSATSYTKFYGKIVDINPAPGRYATQQVVVTAHDGIADLLDADARAVTLQVNQTESQLIAAVIAAVPAAAQPLAQSLDAGVDTFPWAFDNLESGVKALPLIRDCALSSTGMAFIRGDGTFIYKNRHTRATVVSSVTINDTMHGFSAPSSSDRCWNKVRATSHPKVVSAAATDELYTLPTGDSTNPIGAGATVTVWTDYSDPNDRTAPVGGYQVVTVLVGGTHYAANSAADGSGSNLTANIAATLTPFASTGKWTLVNSGAAGYITLLKVIGKAVRDPGPQTFEASSVQPYGEHSIDIDLPYQADAAVTQSTATFIEAQFRDLQNQADSLTFLANYSDAFMTQALTREPGDAITVTETATGVTLLEAIIYRVALSVDQNGMLTCTWGLGPASPYKMWQIGVVGASEIGVSSVVGF